MNLLLFFRLLRMYRIDGRDLETTSSIHYTELYHAQDEEHTERVET